MAKVIWRQDVALARRPRDQFEVATNHLHVTESAVALLEPEVFAAWTNDVHSSILGADREELLATAARGHRASAARGRARALERKMKMWSPFASCVTLAAVKVGDEAVTEPRARAAALSSYWAPVFSRKAWAPPAAQRCVDRMIKPFDFSTVPPPSHELMVKVARQATHSAPGIDGPPCSARAESPHCLEVLRAACCWLLSGQGLFDAESITLLAFLPKGEDESDGVDGRCARPPDQVRVLGLRNWSSKILTATVNVALQEPLAKIIPLSQRGFVRGRNFGYDILEVDLESRWRSAQPDVVQKSPITVSFDFAQAFPSLNQLFLVMVLRRFGFPETVIEFAIELYAAVLAVTAIAGVVIPLFWQRSGIIRGDGLSGSLFAVAMSPVLFDAEADVEKKRHGIVRACADDVAAVLVAFARILRMLRIMRCVDRLANLVLKSSKCHVVPTEAAFSEPLQSKIQAMLAQHVPQWADFKVACRQRARAVGDGVTSVTMSARYCATRYLPLPWNLRREEPTALAEVFKMPIGALAVKDWVQSVQVATVSALIQAAGVALSKFRALLSRHWRRVEGAIDFVPLPMASSRALAPIWWKLPSHAEFVADALGIAALPEGASHPQALLTVGRQALFEELEEAGLRGRRPAVQQRARAAVESAWLEGHDPSQTFERRLLKWWPELAEKIHAILWGQLGDLVSTASPAWAFQVIRSFSSGWLTPRRILDARGRRSCILGCDAPDCFSHCVNCDRLSWAVSLALGRVLPGGRFIEGGPLSWLGLGTAAEQPLGAERFEHAVIASYFYHSSRPELFVPPDDALAHARAALRAARQAARGSARAAVASGR
ncbi:unnamed protein product [Prorocentrum cordatum]|uniref:Reverse transcriptase domain-containing protein n=1 Tax=Prorocentrum cordatum TaxID=2364126 RepID=A0ABN9TY81_9DINO|nr:unnamed protein product [Polarella glacialis]